MLDIMGGAALRTLLLAAIVQCVLWLLRVRQAQLLLATWTIVLAASIAMPMLLRFAPLRFPVEPALSVTLIGGAADLLQRPSLQVPPSNALVEVRTQPSLGSWLEAVYVVGAFAIVLRVVLGVALSFRLLTRAVPVRPEWATGNRVRISRDIAGPVTIAHVILLPIDVVDWSAEMRLAVLAHERAHVARWDFAMLIVSQLNRALFWFSPLSWWLHRRLVALTELASDDQAMASTRDRLAYAEILLEMGRRSGPVFRGPAMARPSTLPHRIDRILLDQATPRRVSRPQQVLLAVGVTGLSLGVAGLTPGPVSDPAMTLLAQQQSPQNEGTVGPTLHDTELGHAIEQRTAAQQVPVQEGSSRTALPPFATETETEAEPRSHPASASLPSAPLAATASQPPHAATLLPPRPAPRTLTKNTPVLPPSRATGLPTQVAIGTGVRNSGPGPQAFSTKETPSHMAGGSDVTIRTGSPADDDGRSSLTQEVVYRSLSPSLSPGFEGVMGRTCTGTVVVGPRASRNSPQQPDVVAGQTIPAQAQFFRKANGTPWVRFNVFGRPPLDLPVRFAQSGMTWTGEYGISYTVRVSGGNHLAGLAALIANDSAKLEFACMASITHLF